MLSFYLFCCCFIFLNISRFDFFIPFLHLSNFVLRLSSRWEVVVITFTVSASCSALYSVTLFSLLLHPSVYLTCFLLYFFLSPCLPSPFFLAKSPVDEQSGCRVPTTVWLISQFFLSAFLPPPLSLFSRTPYLVFIGRPLFAHGKKNSINF